MFVAGCAKPAQSTPAPSTDVVAAVRDAVARKELAAAARAIESHRGPKPAADDAMSLLAAGELAAKFLDEAESHARSVYDLGRALTPIDQSAQMATAVGRAIEMLANVYVLRGARSDAVEFLERSCYLSRHSVEKRIQKNMNLFSLEGMPRRRSISSESLGPQRLAPLTSLKGRVVFLFFWAHWCPDCKAQAPILAKLITKYEPRGLAVVAPTHAFRLCGWRRHGRARGRDSVH